MRFSMFFASPVASSIFFITILTSIRAFKDAGLFHKFALVPTRVIKERDWPSMLTSTLIHGDWFHLGMNMLVFYLFALQFEQIIGHWQFALFYFGGAILSHLPALFRHKDNPAYRAVGASGAISAIVFAVIFLVPDLPIWGIPGWLFLLLYVAYSMVSTFRGSGRIGHDAHLWGGFAGILMMLVIDPRTATNFMLWLDKTF